MFDIYGFNSAGSLSRDSVVAWLTVLAEPPVNEGDIQGRVDRIMAATSTGGLTYDDFVGCEPAVRVARP